MVVLLLSCQDIRQLSMGIVREGTLERQETLNVPPERYLWTIADRLRAWGISLESIGEVAVVTGPGSFTSSRVSTTIADTIAFARGIPVLGLENPDRLPLESLAAMIGSHALPAVDRFAVPTYDRPPHITT